MLEVALTVNLCTLIYLCYKISFKWIQNGMWSVICAKNYLPGKLWSSRVIDRNAGKLQQKRSYISVYNSTTSQLFFTTSSVCIIKYSCMYIWMYCFIKYPLPHHLHCILIASISCSRSHLHFILEILKKKKQMFSPLLPRGITSHKW